MAKVDNRVDVERIKQILRDGWTHVFKNVPDEKAYAFGLYTDECATGMFAFLLGEKGLEKVAREYVDNGNDTPESAADNLRWSTADSPYIELLSDNVHNFDGRPDVYTLSATASAREVNYRLTAACDALRELDQEGLFGAGAQRESITLYIEGGDVNREWLCKWAKKLNPAPVYKRFEKIGTTDEATGTFTEFGTKKVYETTAYAQTADRGIIAAATQYQLFVFDTTELKQLFARPLPSKDDYRSLGGVAMSGDGKIIAVIPFGGGKRGSEFYIVSGGKGGTVISVALKSTPSAVAVSPAGDWIAVTDQSGALNIFDAAGTLLSSHAGHAAWPRGIAISPDGKTLATGDSNTLIIWETSGWTKRHVIDQPIDGVDFDPTGRLIVSTCRYGIKHPPRAAIIIVAETGVFSRVVTVEGYRIQRAKFSPDGRYVACAMRKDVETYSGTNTSALVEIETGKVVDRLVSDFEQVRDFAFLPHRREIAVAVFGHTRRPLVLWQAKGLA